MGRLDGRVAIVTGAARGIGKAIAGRIDAEGARTVLVDIDGPGCAPRRQACVRRSGFEGDVGDEARVAAIVAEVVRDTGRLDIVVNNAAIQVEARLMDHSVDDFERIVRTNLLGTFLCSRAALPAMIAQGAGVIINLSSILGLTGDALLPVYSMTKAGILGLTRSTAAAYGPYGRSLCGDLPWATWTRS